MSPRTEPLKCASANRCQRCTTLSGFLAGIYGAGALSLCYPLILSVDTTTIVVPHSIEDRSRTILKGIARSVATCVYISLLQYLAVDLHITDVTNMH